MTANAELPSAGAVAAVTRWLKGVQHPKRVMRTMCIDFRHGLLINPVNPRFLLHSSETVLQNVSSEAEWLNGGVQAAFPSMV